jgi:hypothetical protein
LTSFLSKLRQKRPARQKRARKKKKKEKETDTRPRFCRNYAEKGQPAGKGRKKKNIIDGQTDQHNNGGGFEATSTTTV